MILFTGRERTEKLVSEALRCVGEVTFDPQSIDTAPPNRNFSSIPISQSVSHLNDEHARPENSELVDQAQDSSRRDIDGLPGTTNSINGGSQFRNDRGRSRSTSGPPINQEVRGNHEQMPSSVLGGGSLGLDSYMNTGADEFGVRDQYGNSKGYDTMPALGGSNFSQPGGASSNINTPSSSRFTGGPGVTAGHFASFPVRKASLSHDDGTDQPPPPPPPPQAQPPAEQQSQPAIRKLSLGAASPVDLGAVGDFSFAAEVESALARRNGDPPAPNYESHTNDPRVPTSSYAGLPKGAAPPAPWGSAPSHQMPVPALASQGPSSDSQRISGDESILNAHGALRDRDTYGIIEEDEEETQLPYASSNFETNRRNRVSRHVKFDGEGLGVGGEWEDDAELSPQKHTSFDSRQ